MYPLSYMMFHSEIRMAPMSASGVLRSLISVSHCAYASSNLCRVARHIVWFFDHCRNLISFSA